MMVCIGENHCRVSRCLPVVLLAAMFMNCCLFEHMRIDDKAYPDSIMRDIVRRNLFDFEKIPPFTCNMKPGDSYLLVLLPGLPLSDSLLDFAAASGINLTGTITALDKAYRFSKMVNGLIVPSGSYMPSGIDLGDIYFRDGSSTCGLQNSGARGNPDLVRMTSATYNDDFYLTIIVPDESSSSGWVDCSRNYERPDCHGKKRSDSTGLQTPSFRFTGSIKRVLLDRPWFNKELFCYTNGNSQASAMITELIIVKNLQVITFRDVSGKKSPSVQRDTLAVLSSRGMSVLGFVCELL